MVVTLDHYDQFVELMGDFATAYTGWPNDVIKINLMLDTHAFNATQTLLSEVTATQVATNNGYTQDTEVVTVVTSAQAAGVWTLDATVDASWSASGGPIPDTGNCDNAIIYDDTITTPLDALMFSIEFGQNESAGDGTDFIIAWNAAGICTIT